MCDLWFRVCTVGAAWLSFHIARWRMMRTNHPPSCINTYYILILQSISHIYYWGVKTRTILVKYWYTGNRRKTHSVFIKKNERINSRQKQRAAVNVSTHMYVVRAIWEHYSTCWCFHDSNWTTSLLGSVRGSSRTPHHQTRIITYRYVQRHYKCNYLYSFS